MARDATNEAGALDRGFRVWGVEFSGIDKSLRYAGVNGYRQNSCNFYGALMNLFSLFPFTLNH